MKANNDPFLGSLAQCFGCGLPIFSDCNLKITGIDWCQRNQLAQPIFHLCRAFKDIDTCQPILPFEAQRDRRTLTQAAPPGTLAQTHRPV